MKWFHALRYRMLIMIGAIMLVMSAFVISYNIYIYQMKDEQFLTSLERTLDFYTKMLSDSLGEVENFLVAQNQMGAEFQKLENPKKEMDRYLAELSIVSYYRESIERFNDIDGLFMYFPAADAYQGCIGSGVSSKENTTIKYHIQNLTDMFEKTEGQESGWFAAHLQGNYYLIKMLDLQGVYVGSWVRADKLVEQAEEMVDTDKGYLVRIYDQKGNSLTEVKAEQIRGHKYERLTSEVKDRGFSVVLMVERHQGVLAWDNPAMISVVTAILGLVVLVAACWLTFQRFFMRPLDNLVSAMNRLKDGDLDAMVEARGNYEEFQKVNEAFESMTKEIKQLKIDVYEEMLNKQNAELLYLQVQVDPHFLTNCMNLIRNLSMCGENDKVEEAAVYLSKYMRYSLTNSTVIPLERELEHVDSYWRLQKLRYEDQIDIEIIMEPSLGKMRIPTMLVQTFVDNSVKHQFSPDVQLKIKVVITLQGDSYNGWYLNLYIQDNGEGFRHEVLEKLKKHEIIHDLGREHIGIYNVYQRLEILYQDRFRMVFANRQMGGAVVNIDLPVETVEAKMR